MRGINKVILLGRATRDTELRSTTSGTPVSNIRLATNRVVRGKDGDLVEGRLESRSFTDRDGKDRDVTEVIASDVQFLDGPGPKSTDLPAAESSQDSDFDDLDIPFEP